jgi:predicted molibdopterin-dependent oxidoreductase YjgC
VVRLTIDGKEITATENQSILEAARENSIEIPTLCYHARLRLLKSCRICLVDVEGAEMPLASCATPVKEGMVVHTRTDRVDRMRGEALKFLLVNHPLQCPVCDAGGECKLQNLTYAFGIEKNEFPLEERTTPPTAYGTPLIRQWFDRCVMCLRCVNACLEIPGADVLEVAEHGFSSYVKAFRRENCISCGECLHMCPVGALTENLSPIKGRVWQLERVRTTCAFCACGCQLELNTLAKKKVIKVTTRQEPAFGVNQGSLCARGRFGYDFVHHPDRLKTPLVRKSGVLVETSWDEALQTVAEKLSEIKTKHGPGAIAGICSSRGTNEEAYLFQKWMRAGIGTNNVDNGARLSMGASIHGLLATLGSPAMLQSMDDVAHSDLILLVGSDVYADNLIFSNKMREAFCAHGAKVIVVDPRRTKWESWANLWLRPVPGSDLAWINGLVRSLIATGMSSGTEGLTALKASVASFTPEVVEKMAGITPLESDALVRFFVNAKKRAVVFGSGIMQHLHGTDTVKALCNLSLLGEGTALYPVLHQNNARGSCDMGALAEFLPGYARVEEEHARKRYEALWGRPIPETVGLSYGEMFDAIPEGKVKALYVAGEDPLITLPNLERVRNGARQLELLVIQDQFMTNLGEYAHVVLPGVSFAEKDGTFTNMERRVQRVRQAIAPLGDARPDWEIVRDLSSRMGYPMSYAGPEEIMDEIASSVPLYFGTTYSRLEWEGMQWPLPERQPRFAPVEYQDSSEKPDSTYPLWIIPSGFHYHYGIGTTTRRAEGLAKIYPEACVQTHPEDAEKAGLKDGDPVRVVSPRGSVEMVCRISDAVPRGTAYVAMMFYPVFVNALLMPGRDPVGRNPDYKAVIGRIEKSARS